MMAQTVNIPVQMILCCSTAGVNRPLRFRYRKPDESLETVVIEEILVEKPSSSALIGESEYVCKATVEERETIFSLNYNNHTNMWRLSRILM